MRSALVLLLVVLSACGSDANSINSEPRAVKENTGPLEAESPSATDVDGEDVFQSHCSSCHSADGRKMMARSFKGAWGKPVEQEDGTSEVFDSKFFRESVFEPYARITKGYSDQMPPYHLEPEVYEALEGYVRSLGSAD